GHLLGGGTGNGDDADVDAAPAAVLYQLVERLHRDPADVLADLLGVDVVEGHDPESPAGETSVVGQRPPQVPGSDHRYRDIGGEAQLGPDVGPQPVHVVADAADPREAQHAEVTAHDGGVGERGRRQLLRGDALPI